MTRTRAGAGSRWARPLARWVLVALAVLLLAGPTRPTLGAREASDAYPYHAGLVIRHADGRTLYVLVGFNEPEISGAELLQRSGVVTEVTPYGPLGLAVCRVDGEGCPASDCFCRSFGNPAWYWRYYRLAGDGSWVGLQTGPTTRMVRDGDVDGWSWSSTTGDLPPTSFAEIAKVNGLALPAERSTDRSPAIPVSTPSPAATASVAPPSPTAALVLATVEPTGATLASRGVEVGPSGDSRPLDLSRRSTGLPASYVAFLAIVGILLVAGLTLIVRQRSRR